MRLRNSRRFAVLLIAAVGLLAAQASASSAARAAFKSTSHDFGKIKQGDVLTYEFAFTNAGDTTLVIDRLETSCGCTAALASANRIPPGEEGRIKTTFNSQGYYGRITKYIYLISNDSTAKRRELTVSAEIEVPPQARIDLDQYNIDLGVSLTGETPSATVLVKNTGERELRVEIDPQEIQFFVGGKPASFPLLIASGKSVPLEFRFPPQARAGLLRDYVLIRSNDAARSTISVSIYRYVMTKKELLALFEKYGSLLGVRR
jgi:hypothetical protein